jgi:hypothetical protein
MGSCRTNVVATQFVGTLLELVPDNLGPMTQCTVLLEYPIIVGVHEVHEELQMVNKQCNVVVTGQ